MRGIARVENFLHHKNPPSLVPSVPYIYRSVFAANRRGIYEERLNGRKFCLVVKTDFSVVDGFTWIGDRGSRSFWDPGFDRGHHKKFDFRVVLIRKVEFILENAE